jgi:SHS2 domain-containing protein
MDRVHVPSSEGVVHEEHTADLWLTASGESLEECLKRTVSGLYGVMADEFQISGMVKEELILEAESLEVLLVELLSELLFIFDARSSIAMDPSFIISEKEGRFTLRFGYRETEVSVSEGKGGMEVKAATYHGASLRNEGGSWKSRVLLDL